MRQIVEICLDELRAPFSLHNIALAGDKMGKVVGEWHTPSITAYSIQYAPIPA